MKKIIIPFFISAFIVVIAFFIFEKPELFFLNLLQGLSSNRSVYAFTSLWILALDIVLPIPSSIVMYVNGYVLGIVGGTMISLVALLVGATTGYYLGKLTSLGLKARTENISNSVITKYGALVILISRSIPIVSESVCLVCGYNKIPFRHYFILNLIGYTPVCLLHAVFGSLGYDKNSFLIFFSFSLVVSIVIWFLGKSFLKSTKQKVAG